MYAKLLLRAIGPLVALLATHATSPRQETIESGPTSPIRQTRTCVVTRIVDGDTFECDPLGRVRPIGMDTPEIGQSPFDTMATDALIALIPVGSSVALEADVEERDRYGRLLAYVWRDSVLVNWVMVRGGWAVAYTVPPNVQYVDYFTTAQRLAREEALGLWALGGFDCQPRDRRRGRCD